MTSTSKIDSDEEIPTSEQLESQYCHVINMCSEYLCKRVNSYNCIEMILFADDNQLNVLIEYCIQYAAAHSGYIFMSDDFLEATTEQMKRLLCLFRCHPIPKDDIYNGILLWTEYKRKRRSKYLDEMLMLVIRRYKKSITICLYILIYLIFNLLWYILQVIRIN